MTDVREKLYDIRMEAIRGVHGCIDGMIAGLNDIKGIHSCTKTMIATLNVIRDAMDELIAEIDGLIADVDLSAKKDCV